MKEPQRHTPKNPVAAEPQENRSSLGTADFKAQDIINRPPAPPSVAFSAWLIGNVNQITRGRLTPGQARIFTEQLRSELPSIAATLELNAHAGTVMNKLGNLWRTSAYPDEIDVSFKVQIGKLLSSTASMSCSEKSEELAAECIKNLRVETINSQMIEAIEALVQFNTDKDSSLSHGQLSPVGQILASKWSIQLLSSSLPKAKTLHDSLITTIRPLLDECLQPLLHVMRSESAQWNYYSVKDISLHGTALAAFLYEPSTQAEANLIFNKILSDPRIDLESLICINRGVVPLSNPNIDQILRLQFSPDRSDCYRERAASFISGLLSIAEQRERILSVIPMFSLSSQFTFSLQAITLNPSLWKGLADSALKNILTLRFGSSVMARPIVFASEAHCFSDFLVECEKTSSTGGYITRALSNLATNSPHEREFRELRNKFTLYRAFSNVSEELRKDVLVNDGHMSIQVNELLPTIIRALKDTEKRKLFLTRLAEWSTKDQEEMIVDILAQSPEQWMHLGEHLTDIYRWEMPAMPAKEKLRTGSWQENLVDSLLHLSRESFGFAESKINRLIFTSSNEETQATFEAIRDEFSARYAEKVWNPKDPQKWVKTFFTNPSPPVLSIFNSWASEKGLPGEELLREARASDSSRRIENMQIQGYWPQCAFDGDVAGMGAWIADNIHAVEAIDARVPGGAAFLYSHYGIRNFARYPVELLENQIQATNDAISGKKSNCTPVILAYPLSDWNGAFMQGDEASRVSDEQKRRKGGLPAIVFESKNVVEFLIFAHRTTRWFGKSQCAIVVGHGDEEGIRLAHDSKMPGHEIERKHLEGHRIKAIIRDLFTPGAQILLSSCATGAEGGFAEKLSGLFDGMGVKVIAPVVSSYLRSFDIRGRSAQNLTIEAKFAKEDTFGRHRNITRIIETDLAALQTVNG